MADKIYKLVVTSPKRMRYLTAGDYFKIRGGWEIVTADMGNADYNFLVLIHELVELYLTQKRGITEPKIKKFDEWFEKEKAKGKFRKVLSPGRLKSAPYRREHMFAVRVENMIRKELGASRAKQWKREDEVFEKIQNHFSKLKK